MTFDRKNSITYLILAVLVLALAGFFIWKGFSPEQPQIPTENIVKDQPENPDNQVVDNEKPDLSKKDAIKAQIPSLSRPIPQDASPDMVSQIQEASRALSDNYDYLQGWLQLGILRKAVGDYEGAIEAWNFTGVIRPYDATSFLNLGDLYGYYLKDVQKAEQSFLAAIAAEPDKGYAYFKTYEFYRDVLQNEARARQILEQGVAANPSDSQLQVILDSVK